MNVRYALPLFAMVSIAAPRVASAHDTRSDEAAASSVAPEGGLPTIRLLTRVDVDTAERQPVANGCEVQSIARGSYLTSNADGQASRLRDVDVTGVSVLECDGREVRSIKQRFVFPTVESRERLASMLSQDLTAHPKGTDCAWTPTFRFDGDELRAASVVNSCSPRETVAALRPLRAWDRVGTPPAARGGGPVTNK
jgi:hypothetical protein